MTRTKRPGPKTNCEDVVVNKQLLTLLTENQYQLLDTLSIQMKKSKSELVRDALNKVFFNTK